MSDSALKRELFGTDGIRARAGEYPLDDDTIVRVARAAGTVFAEAGGRVIVACDTRESSPHIVEKITEGLVGVGVNVVNAGVLPTPGLAQSVASHDELVAGVMVTASHNPFADNGIKLFQANGHKLADQDEQRVAELVVRGVPDREVGTVHTMSFAAEYLQFLTKSVPDLDLSSLKLAVDSANGATSGLARRVFEQCGARVVSLGDEPNGRNINDQCGATDTRQLCDRVKRDRCDVGVAFDGDGDRVILVDHLGRPCNGDHMLYILAVTRGYQHVVATSMTNLGTEQALATRGIQLDRTAVGDRYVQERLQTTGFLLGAEQSGHVILTEFANAGDGLLAALHVLDAVRQSGRHLAEWRDLVPQVPQSLVGIPLDDTTKLARPAIVKYLDAETRQLGAAGRLVVRPSGTEPLLRVMVESEDAAARAAEIASKLEELLR